MARRRLARDLGVAPSVLLGRTPAERHEHFDADDRLTGYTVVYREPEWTDDDLRQMQELVEYERGLCECGWHESLATDKANHFTFEQRVCPVCAGTAQYARKQAHADEHVRKARGENTPPETPLPSDGRRTFVRMMSPAEVEAAKARRAT